MAPAKGSSWSKDPTRDRWEDEIAVDVRLIELLETAALVLRSRQTRRKALAAQTQKSDPVLTHETAAA